MASPPRGQPPARIIMIAMRAHPWHSVDHGAAAYSRRKALWSMRGCWRLLLVAACLCSLSHTLHARRIRSKRAPPAAADGAAAAGSSPGSSAEADTWAWAAVQKPLRAVLAQLEAGDVEAASSHPASAAATLAGSSGGPCDPDPRSAAAPAECGALVGELVQLAGSANRAGEYRLVFAVMGLVEKAATFFLHNLG